jgi:hypothetical protein
MTTAVGHEPDSGWFGRLREDRLRLVLALIAALTILSGLTQVLVPGVVLDVLSASTSLTARHFFAIVGMFMVLFGGAMLHAMLGRSEQPVVVLWASLQKFGASLAVVIGVGRDVFSALALLVAAFDLLSGVLGMAYWRRIRR